MRDPNTKNVELSQSQNKIDAIISSIVAQANVIDPVVGGSEEQALYSDVNKLFQFGADSRIRALLALREVRNLVTRTSIAFRLIDSHSQTQSVGIHTQALDALSRSAKFEDHFLLLQIAFRIAKHVDRKLLKRGLVRVWHKSSGKAKAAFSIELEKRGFHGYEETEST